MIKTLLTVFYLIVCLGVSAQVPSITSFSPMLAPVGTTITINGNNFSNIPNNNIVFFGAVRATVTGATNTQLLVVAPTGATYNPISVTVNNLTAYSSLPFSLVYGGGGQIIDSSFGSRVDTSLFSTYPEFIALHDLDGDGKSDIIVPDGNGNKLMLFKNTSANGLLALAARTNLVIKQGPNAMALGDLDGDGKTDIVTTCSQNDSAIITKNISTIGQLSFAPNVSFKIGARPYDAEVGDFDGDGKLDIVATNSTVGAGGLFSFSIMRNTSTNGTIGFAPPVLFDLPSGMYGVKMALADVNGDGKLDILLANTNTGNTVNLLSVYINTATVGNLSFAPKIDYVTAKGNYRINTGDLNGDGLLDIVITNYNSKFISVFKNTTVGGSFALAPKIDYYAGLYATSLVVADLDGDSKLDIGHGKDTLQGSLVVYENTSNGGNLSFAAPVVYRTPYGSLVMSIAAGDLDGDGTPDVAATDNRLKTLMLFRNRTQYPAIRSFSPISGVNGSTVSISGINFTNVSAVKVGNVPVANFTVVSPTLIAAVVAGGGTGRVAVTNTYGTGTLSGFTYNVPTISSFAPASGPVGTLVTISGTNFGSAIGDNKVYFGAVKATVITASPNELVVKVPIGANYRPITVTKNNLTAFSAKPFITTFAGGGSALASNSFAPKIELVTGQGPQSVHIADLDGDDKLDIMTANYTNGSLSLFRNTSGVGNITFAPKQEYLLNCAGGPADLITTDFDGDGKMDMVVCCQQSTQILVLRNTSMPGSFAFASYLLYVPNLTGFPSDICVTDFDKDGKPDFGVGHGANGKSITIFKNTSIGPGDISFASETTFPGGFNYGIATADFDMDNRPDVAYSSWLTNAIAVMRNTANTTNDSISFSPATTYATSSICYRVLVGDLDGDDLPDITVGNYNTNTVSSFRNTSTSGTIGFSPKADFASGKAPFKIAQGDIDGDGKADIITQSIDSAACYVLRNISTIGNLAFEPPYKYASGTGAFCVAIGDIDGDGKPEIVVSNFSISKLSILRNRIGNPDTINLCPGASRSIASNLTGSVYQWQLNAGSGFVNINDGPLYMGTATNVLQLVNIPSSLYGYEYNCLVNGVRGNTTALKFYNTWNGNINSVWSDPANWSCGTVPDANTDVVINNGTVVVNTTATIRTLTIAPGVNFTIAPGIALTVLH